MYHKQSSLICFMVYDERTPGDRRSLQCLSSSLTSLGIVDSVSELNDVQRDV